jgi:hypothetical protein
MPSTALRFTACAGKRAVEIDDMEILRPGLGKQHRLRRRIIAIDGRAGHIALGQAARTCPPLRSMAGKTITASTPENARGAPGRKSWLFSGWNCTPSTLSFAHRRDEPAPWSVSRRDVRAILGHEVVGVQEIGLARHDEFVVMHRGDIVPAHVRHLDARIARLDGAHFAADPAQALGHAELDAAVRQQLHAHANAKERHAARQHALAHRLDKARHRRAAPRCRHSNAPTPGSTMRSAARTTLGSAGDAHAFRARRLQRIGDERRLPAP